MIVCCAFCEKPLEETGTVFETLTDTADKQVCAVFVERQGSQDSDEESKESEEWCYPPLSDQLVITNRGFLREEGQMQVGLYGCWTWLYVGQDASFNKDEMDVALPLHCACATKLKKIIKDTNQPSIDAQTHYENIRKGVYRSSA
jgi:hypothetical protein